MDASVVVWFVKLIHVHLKRDIGGLALAEETEKNNKKDSEQGIPSVSVHEEEMWFVNQRHEQ